MVLFGEKKITFIITFNFRKKKILYKVRQRAQKLSKGYYISKCLSVFTKGYFVITLSPTFSDKDEMDEAFFISLSLELRKLFLNFKL